MSNLRSLTFDAIIIGGGGSGLRAALELAKSGKKTAVLSKVFPTRSHGFCSGRYYLCDCLRRPERRLALAHV
ncbi:hypothetical protein HAALTHF_48020n [Vreelandella aquamarina]|nr:hypothetical protein HAALTHF_48020n [Halomonas axialensis]